MGEKLREKLALFKTSSCRPKLPPIIKAILLLRVRVSWIKEAKPSELKDLPFMSKAITKSVSEILSRIRLPSVCLILVIKASLKFCGAFSCCKEKISGLEKCRRRFKYSAMASDKYFSFIEPMAMIFMFIFYKLTGSLTVPLKAICSFKSFPTLILLEDKMLETVFRAIKGLLFSSLRCPK